MFFVFLALIASVEGGCSNGNNLISSGLTCDQKKEIVNVHNEVRNKIASGNGMKLPAAEGMPEMRWNETIAQQAQELADRCTNEHDTGSGSSVVGQNLALITSVGKVEVETMIQRLMNGWINEEEKYEPGVFSTESGHFSQMIWGNSHGVGCGFSLYEKDGVEYRQLVCNYSPPGNIIGEPPYTYGPINCSKYGFCSSNYSHLCTVDKQNI